MIYAIHILRRAQKELAGLPQEPYVHVRDAIRELAEEPRPNGSKKLVGRNGWRTRVSSYRVVYEINDAHRAVTIMHIGHRRDVNR
jgi:mRNA interferase RelE/StbE